MEKRKEKKKKSLHHMTSVLRQRRGCLLQGRQPCTVCTAQIPLLQRAEPHLTPSTPKGSLFHSTPILTNLCGFNNVHNGV